MNDGESLALGFDVGGSGIKAGAVDTSRGLLAGQRHRIKTPNPSTPEAVIEVIAKLAGRLLEEAGVSEAPIGVGVPSVVIDGCTKTAANIDPGWIEFPVEATLSSALGRPVTVVNDADAAGVAEVRFGAGRDQRGVIVVLTLGTGVGSGVFVDGRLVPNTELGHMEIRGKDAEHRSAAAIRVKRELSWRAWAEDLDEHLHAIDRLFWPNLFILGGGISKDPEKFIPRLTVRPPVVPAELRNDAGIIGAALLAADRARAR